MKKIYVFSNTKGGNEGPCYAMAEDGTVLGSHFCSNEEWARYDLGVEKGYRPDRHEYYASHYPEGYEMEFVPNKDFDSHEGLKKAIALNQLQKEEANG